MIVSEEKLEDVVSAVGGLREELSKIRTGYSGLSDYTNLMSEELK